MFAELLKLQKRQAITCKSCCRVWLLNSLDPIGDFPKLNAIFLPDRLNEETWRKTNSVMSKKFKFASPRGIIHELRLSVGRNIKIVYLARFFFATEI
jgi:hypothetical protein